MLMLTVASLLALQAPPMDEGPLLKRQRSNRGPDGNVAGEGVLLRRFCFSAPTPVCVPAGSTVSFTSHRGGVHSDPTAPRPATVLRTVDAVAPFEAFGLTFDAHRPTPPDPDQDASERVYSLSVFGNEVRGLLARPFTFAGVTIGRGPVEVSVDQTGAITAMTGTLGTTITVDRFTIPQGSAVSVCPDGLHTARAPRTRKPRGKAIVAGAERHDAIVATRAGEGKDATTPLPWVCERQRIGYAVVEPTPPTVAPTP